MIGYPEARIILSQAAIYLATCEKSNSSYKAIGNAQRKIRETGTLPVPLHLRNAPTKLMKDLNYGKDYKYSHDHKNNFAEQEFLPDAISGTAFFSRKKILLRSSGHRRVLRKRWGKKYGY